MSLEDKIKNTAQDVAGKAKEGLGEATGDEQLKTEGKVNQATASAKDALADAKDAASEKGRRSCRQGQGPYRRPEEVIFFSHTDDEG